MVVQDSLTQVVVTWTAPSATPAPTGYRVTLVHVESSTSQQGNAGAGTSSLSFSIMNNQYGCYTARVVSLYEDRFPDESIAVVSAETTVRSKFNCNCCV